MLRAASVNGTNGMVSTTGVESTLAASRIGGGLSTLALDMLWCLAPDVAGVANSLGARCGAWHLGTNA